MDTVMTPVATQDLAVLKQFRVIFKSIRKHFHAIENAVGVSGAQLWALAVIVDKPGLRVTELARLMSVHQSTASNLLDQLVDAGLVIRTRGAGDNRTVLLTPTPAGIERVRNSPAPVRGLLPDALDKLAPETLQSLHQCLGELLGKMEALEKADTLWMANTPANAAGMTEGIHAG
ncbi:MAG: MarR family transcriptional regulator [Rhodocyclaceae bacterium]